ncbi:unnamed protein product [Phaedon cochleariae]|uniref:Aminopeptidase n=1 Tax=Phaedon cochleariae TaxID=80249 RepID=A0A9P0DTC6_PHACE|nr:unnamed protein product [Phaedon cochleariae]
MVSKGTQICIFLLLISEQISKNEAERHRLPDTAIPLSYILTIKIEDINSDTLSGSVVISFNTNEATNETLLHASLAYMNITEIVLNADYNKTCNISSHNENTGIVTISCPENTSTDEPNTLYIAYAALLSETSDSGIYRTKVYEANGNVDKIIATQLAPSFARRMFPCFDEPRFKTTFDLFVVHPQAYEVLANSPILSTTFTQDGWAETEFYTSPPMSTYLLGFVMGKFLNVSAAATDVNAIYRVFTRPEMINYTGTALSHGPQLVKAMGDLTGIQYRDMEDKQLYQVALPDLKFQAMENWGLLTYREAEILDEADKTTALSKQNIIPLMARQISNQWFGNYATMDWWSNVWLNDGFATYFQYYLPDKIDGLDMDLDKQFTVNVLQLALREDAYPESSALSGDDIDDTITDEYFKKADYLTHGKGASVIRMMKSVLGEDKFQEKIKLYLQVNKFNTTNPTSLLESLQLGNMMEQWIYKSGYPLLHVTLNNNQVEITQEQFSNVKNNSDSSTQWNIPVTYTTSEEKNFNREHIDWLKKDEALSIELKDGSWIVLNIQQTGFYRVSYDDVLWERLIVALNRERTTIHVLNRAQLVDDAFSLSQVGRMSYINAFRLADFLLEETEYAPWVSALNAISYMMDRVTDEDTIELLKSRTLQYIDSAFPTLRKIEGNSHIDILKETMILRWKCSLGNEDCIEYAKQSFQEYQQSRSLSDFNEKEIILCYGAKHSTNPEHVYRYLLSSFEDSKSPAERETILMAIGCISKKTILSQFLKETLDSDSIISRTYYSPVVFESVLSNNDFGCDVTLEFLERHLKIFVEMYRDFLPISTIVNRLSDKIKTEEQIGELKEIIANSGGIPDSDKILNKIDYHLKWAAENSEKIKTSLIQHKSQAFTHSQLFLPIIISILLSLTYTIQ